MRKKFLLFGFFILLLALIPRSVEVLGGNYLFGFDQGLFYQDIKRIVVDHKFTLIGSFTGGQGGLFQGPGWYYLLSIPFIFWNGNPYGGMVLMLLISFSTIALSIYYGSKILGKPTGLTIGFLLAVSPALISQARFIWPPFPVSFLSVLYLYFIYRVFQKKQKFLYFSSFTIGLMSNFELATAGTFFAHFFITSLLLVIKKFVSFRFFLFSLLSFILTLSPLIIFNLRHENIMIKGLLNTFAGGASEHQVTSLYIFRMFLNHFDVFKFNFLSFFPQSGYLWPLILFTLVIGAIVYVKDSKIKLENRLFLSYLLTAPLTMFTIFMLYLWPIWEWWILQLLIFYIFAFGIISVYFWQRSFFKPFIFALYLIFIASFLKDTAGFYKNDFNDYGGTAKIRGKIDAIDYIYRDAKGEKFGLLIFTPPVYTFAYDYVLWWHGGRKYNYIPYKEKKGNYYLLIEPDPHKPWTYKGWLETVIGSGNIIKTVQLPSGFIIQERAE